MSRAHACFVTVGTVAGGGFGWWLFHAPFYTYASAVSVVFGVVVFATIGGLAAWALGDAIAGDSQRIDDWCDELPADRDLTSVTEVVDVIRRDAS